MIFGSSIGEIGTPPKKHEPPIEASQVQGEKNMTRPEEQIKILEQHSEKPTPCKGPSTRKKKVSIVEPSKEGRALERITRIRVRALFIELEA